MWTPDGYVRFRMVAFDRICNQTYSPPVGGPTRQPYDIGLKETYRCLNGVPRECGQIDDFDGVSGCSSLCGERKQTVRDLEEVRVEVGRVIITWRTINGVW
jgi:hypothetical protein